MSVTLHIDPEDYPVVNQPQQLLFLYHDYTNKFSAVKCICRARILFQNSEVYNELVPATRSYFGRLPYTFTSVGVYRIGLTGNPNKEGDFTPFNVSYSVRVAAGVPGESYSSTTKVSTINTKDKVIVVIGGLVAIIALILSGYMFYNNLKKSK